jgi:hypothetical protein
MTTKLLNGHKIYQMALKYSNGHKIYQHFPFQGPAKCIQVGFLVLKYTIWQPLCRLRHSTRGRCYDHNFLQFLHIFGENIGVLLKIQYYAHIFAKTSISLSKNANNFAKFFCKNILNSITSVVGPRRCSFFPNLDNLKCWKKVRRDH